MSQLTDSLLLLGLIYYQVQAFNMNWTIKCTSGKLLDMKKNHIKMFHLKEEAYPWDVVILLHEDRNQELACTCIIILNTLLG